MKAIGNMAFPGRADLLARFRQDEDEDEQMRYGARLLQHQE